ncbi:hypothetical protein EW145_g6824 [Phellinidium pouzarii]|uniref:Uncharacterized protein n=1 Tax=Phellinidium pouzarii TaxID=167371 RepID=A0A4S4KTE5_9AGAM|nr:hypothetical protein EW145_g6824 [Phellinidium pouzarii]
MAVSKIIGRFTYQGLCFEYVDLPAGIDDDKDDDDDDRHAYMFILTVEEDMKGETDISYNEITLDMNNSTVSKWFNRFVDFGCSEEELKSYWATLPSTSVTY